MNLEKKIPPPIVTLIFVGLAYICAISTPNEYYGRFVSIAFGSVLTGLIAIIVANIQFRKASTTINPMQPETASTLVDTGLFAQSRNPMYVGMAMILTGFCIYFGSLFGLLAIPAFVQYMNRFQIIPEEEALHKVFGQSYTNYCNTVRRWI